MAYKQQLAYEALRSFDSASLTGTYQALGTPLVNPGTIVKLVNNSTVLVTISDNGVRDVDIAPAGSFWLYDATTNRTCDGNPIFIPAGRQYSVKGTAGTGSIYLVVQYNVQASTTGVA